MPTRSSRSYRTMPLTVSDLIGAMALSKSELNGTSLVTRTSSAQDTRSMRFPDQSVFGGTRDHVSIEFRSKHRRDLIVTANEHLFVVGGLAERFLKDVSNVKKGRPLKSYCMPDVLLDRRET